MSRFAFVAMIGCAAMGGTSMARAADVAVYLEAAPHTPLEFAKSLVHDLDASDTSYRHRNEHVAWKGIRGAARTEAHADCSGLINALLEIAYGYDRKTFLEWLGRARPLAASYHDAISAHKRFESVTRVADAVPGDLIAIRYPEDSENSGHIALIAELARKRPRGRNDAANLDAWEVRVIDSSRSGHGKSDSRRRPDGSFGGGVGTGTMVIYTAADGSVAGYAWSDVPGSRFFAQAERDLVIGRLATRG